MSFGPCPMIPFLSLYLIFCMCPPLILFALHFYFKSACLCAEKELSLVQKKGIEKTSSVGNSLTWSREHLPVAIKRMKVALMAAPGHEPLQGMIARAEEILNIE